MASPFIANYVKIGYIDARHFPRMQILERLNFDEPNNTSYFRNLLNQTNNLGRTIECYGRIVGFVIYKINKPLIVRIAITPEYQVPGVIDKVMEHLMSLFKRPHVTYLMAVVNRSELRAQLLLEKMKFKMIRTIERFFEGRREDAYLMAYYSYADIYDLVSSRNKFLK